MSYLHTQGHSPAAVRNKYCGPQVKKTELLLSKPAVLKQQFSILFPPCAGPWRRSQLRLGLGLGLGLGLPPCAGPCRMSQLRSEKAYLELL
jgi:hypothetical protein